MAAEPWFHVAPNDVFPERFGPFMGLPRSSLDVVQEKFGELFDPSWWQDLQAGFRQGLYPDTPPYPRALRLA